MSSSLPPSASPEQTTTTPENSNYSSNPNSPRNALPNSSLSGSMKATVVDATSYELHEDDKTDVATDVKRRAQGFFDSLKQRTAMFRQNLTTQAWLFITNVILSVLCLFGCCAALFYEAFNHQHRYSTVGEDYGLNMCSYQVFKIYLTTSASYSISDLMIGCLFALWYAFRAVRHEKEALLVVFSLCVLGVVGRALYFAFVTAYYWVTGLSLATLQVFLVLGSVGLSIAVAQTWRVGRSFGWRMYTKGVASVADVKRMGKLKTLDAAAKLDLFLTINAFNTFFFFSPDTTIRYLGFAFTAVTALFLLAIPGMVRNQMFFLGYVFAVIGLVLPAFYSYLLVSIFSKNPNHCFEQELTNCAAASNITQIPRLMNFTSFPALYNTTGCVDCRNETDYSPNRLCWSNMIPTDDMFNVTQLSYNETLQHSFLGVCLDQADSRIDECCREFGKCELKVKLVDSNAPMAVFVVICAIITRLATMYFGVQQARLMNVPSVEEMIARGQRNVSSALSFQFMGSQSPPSTARIRNVGDHEEDDSTSSRRRGQQRDGDENGGGRSIFSMDHMRKMAARDQAENDFAAMGEAAVPMMMIAAKNKSPHGNSKNNGGYHQEKEMTTKDRKKAAKQAEEEKVDSALPTPRYELAFAEGRRL